MRIEQLHYFVETVNYKSINKASEKLFVSQSTVSEALTKLEIELGVSLLNRTHLGVVVTAEGRIFYDIAFNILEQIDCFKDEILKTKEPCKEKEKLVCFVTPEMLDFVMPEFIKSMAIKYPRMLIACRAGDFLDGIKSVIDKKVEWALILIHKNILESAELKKILEDNKLIVNIFAETEVMITVNRKSHLAKKDTISIREILKYPVVFFKTDLDPFWHKLAYKKYGELNIGFIAGSWELCDKYTSLYEDVYGFTSKTAKLCFTENKQIRIKEKIFYIAALVQNEEFLCNQAIYETLQEICERNIAD